MIIKAHNAHYLAIMWADSNSAILFDAPSGKETCRKCEMKDIILSCFVGMKKLEFQYGKNGIQDTGNLSCGKSHLFCIVSKYIRSNDRPDLHYVSDIVKHSKNTV